jgi:hypothetical protein
MSANKKKKILKGMTDLLDVWIHIQKVFQEFHCFCCANTINLKDVTKSDTSCWKEYALSLAHRTTGG